MHQILLIAMIGLAVGLLVGLTGVGGGGLLIPILVIAVRVSPIVAVGTGTLFIAATKLAAGWQYHRKGLSKELTLRAAKEVEANLLLHPSVGLTKPGDVEYYVRVRCYQALFSKYPKDTVRLALLPLAPWRENTWRLRDGVAPSPGGG